MRRAERKASSEYSGNQASGSDRERRTLSRLRPTRAQSRTRSWSRLAGVARCDPGFSFAMSRRQSSSRRLVAPSAAEAALISADHGRMAPAVNAHRGEARVQEQVDSAPGPCGHRRLLRRVRWRQEYRPCRDASAGDGRALG